MMPAHKNLSRPRIFEFKDYRSFISAMIDYLKESSQGFSHRKFARRAGFNSPSVLLSILSKRSGLTKESARKVAKGFGLNPNEALFLLRLVQLDQARLPEAKGKIWQGILKDKHFAEIHPLAQAEFRYYSNWYYPLVREMIAMGIQAPDVIESKMEWAVTLQSIERAIEDLKAMKLVEETGGGLRVTNQSVMTEREPQAHEVLLYQREMISKAQEALTKFPRERRDIRSSTFSIDTRLLPEFKSFLQSVLVQAIEKFEKRSENPDAVYQLNLQAFPLTSK